jgi:hypothetical protein
LVCTVGMAGQLGWECRLEWADTTVHIHLSLPVSRKSGPESVSFDHPVYAGRGAKHCDISPSVSLIKTTKGKARRRARLRRARRRALPRSAARRGFSARGRSWHAFGGCSGPKFLAAGPSRSTVCRSLPARTSPAVVQNAVRSCGGPDTPSHRGASLCGKRRA